MGLKSVLHFQDWSNAHIPEILQEIYLRQVYLPYLIGRKGLTLVDGGFNIGLWSIYASEFAKTIYAFEPTKSTYDLGLKNLKDNDITNVTVFKKALALEDGQKMFYHCSNSTMNSLRPEMNDVKTGEMVETIRFDTFVTQEKIEKIDLLKLDIEGSETEVLMGEGFQKIAPIVDTLIYEYHSWSTANVNLVNTTLKDFGFTRFRQLGIDAIVYACTK
jgi:FkbM family methyltransferase